ncbi:Filamin-B [Thelohanellus kitauei]|uniref:Filamin-B n=1 Tax=Thelohanellus kitauei TaxID=669202 RepID=A0A0C2JEM4_THEKT|nr:Filamin-B [Thelohanellus kitauei]
MKDSLKVSIIPPKGDILFPPVETYHGDKEHFKQWLGKTGTIYQIEFVTKDCGEYVIHVSFINHPIPGFPKILEAQRYEAKPHNIIIKTPKNTEFRVGDLCSIIVDARQTKPGRLEAKIKDPNDANVSYEILPIHSKNDNDKSRVYQVDFNLQEQGVYEVTFFWNDKKISDQPLHFTAISSMPELSMVNNVVIDGYVGETLSVTIDNVGDHLNYLDCTCYDPSENCVKISIQPSPKNDGSCELVVTPLIPGMHKIEVTMFEKQISGSPFYFNVSYPINAQKAKAYGDGLISGVLHQSKGIFYVSTDKAGGGLLQVAIQGPKDGFKMSIQYKEELEEGEPPTVIVDYEPIVCGLYIINILWSGDHIPGSPFKVYNVKSSTDLQQIAKGRFQLNLCHFH